MTQEAFVTAYRKLHTFRGEASFRTWLLTIAWRKALDRRVSLTRWLKMTVSGAGFTDEAIDPTETIASNSPSAEETVAADELRREVRRSIRMLPRKLRDALLLAGSGEHSYEQIARMLEIPVGTVKWRISEARRLLRRQLGVKGSAHD